MRFTFSTPLRGDNISLFWLGRLRGLGSGTIDLEAPIEWQTVMGGSLVALVVERGEVAHTIAMAADVADSFFWGFTGFMKGEEDIRGK
ncbi:hypothetical protein TSUD_84820 [Trifolium subterraneum]|uniref:Uncharacterized protein n=1 Tax=Trifolium subterraneum TaxID=3900 RepID=A0A2Z6LPQ6_TRISU|nr:hypothetical protein TSUD_84820 [Trifolium subterraneum]